MQYSSTEAHSGQALVLPIAEFAPAEDEFFARINPFLDYQMNDLAEFAQEYGYDYYAADELQHATLDGEELDISLGLLIRFSDTCDVDIAPFEDWEFEQALNVEPDQYIGYANIVEATEYCSTSYSF